MRRPGRNATLESRLTSAAVRAKIGDRVTVRYTLKTTTGELLDTTEGRSPLQFTLGSGEFISGFDQAVVGMQPGEIKRGAIPPSLAHGDHRAARVRPIKKLGERFESPPPAGFPAADAHNADRVSLFVVTKLPDSSAARDYNHPLAGKALAFEIELLAVSPRVG